jgi:hypothetical protein
MESDKAALISPTQFNISLNEKIVKWIYSKGITLLVSTKINTTFFADDQNHNS